MKNFLRIFSGIIIPWGFLISSSWVSNTLSQAIVMPIVFIVGAFVAPLILMIFFIKKKQKSLVIGFVIGLVLEIVLLVNITNHLTRTMHR